MTEYPSKLVGEAVEEIAKLPGIGRKTALRLVLHLLKQPKESTLELSQALSNLREKIQYCSECHIISDSIDCTCRTVARDVSLVCVVEDTPDVLAVRNTGQYQGMFHVLGGRISPMDGVGPDEIKIESLVDRVRKSGGEIKEIILALSATMEGDTTAFYITKRLQEFDLKITTIARGIPVGGELEFADEVTLGRSIASRVTFDQG
ncbi:MAG: recombination mediator RecR [Cyclobacteriaceae bacterium]|nr:recombination mediator RecR [Cyclobacteriaceae bacterium HetDA_MAG_MS6]